MNIAYNSNDIAVEIFDDLRTQYLIYKGLLLLILINAFMRLYKAPEDAIIYVQTIWAVLGILSVLFLAYFFIRKSSLEKIQLKQIKRFKVKSFLGRKRYVFILKNGKERKLSLSENDLDLNYLLHMCARVGIPVCQKSQKYLSPEEYAPL